MFFWRLLYWTWVCDYVSILEGIRQLVDYSRLRKVIFQNSFNIAKRLLQQIKKNQSGFNKKPAQDDKLQIRPKKLLLCKKQRNLPTISCANKYLEENFKKIYTLSTKPKPFTDFLKHKVLAIWPIPTTTNIHPLKPHIKLSFRCDFNSQKHSKFPSHCREKLVLEFWVWGWLERLLGMTDEFNQSATFIMS